MEVQLNNCPFCDLDRGRIIAKNNLAYTVYDGYPVTELHTLIIPKRHAETYFDLSDQERDACYQLMEQSKDAIEAEDPTVTGFNIGINHGESAGQTIFHSHIHLIPRREGDVENPRGGIRHLIPGKGFY